MSSGGYFAPYPARREDFSGTADEQFYADRHYYLESLQQGLANARASQQEKSRALAYWNSACNTIQRVGVSTKEAASVAYKAAETWGKNHPVAMAVGGLAASTGVGYAASKA
ncbi:uncharacterized protein EKO05_0007389 [Ascochyta rabiei]|uniref:Uncharacterized protein n=1 Tax=Didymella rabiei TaxID=5454 RepID=A0A163HC53_DIDRA|nr:uncharacterized protein EKO05_0007389 [Ascochyta rabiei]KZM25235.1 hypothetical protein ST47_g3644 [Ascochyta rabiei]UPX17012.1 hypothetical protein EKO05_0007389 [Ascochyta rabiei]